MIQPVSFFEEPWPSNEKQMVVDAIRAAIAAPYMSSAEEGVRINAGGRTEASSDNIERSLSEAGRRWALAHQSASLMRSRLEVLESSMDTGPEVDLGLYHRAWRVVSDAATWTSLNLLEEAALVDPLTGVGNRRALDKMLTGAMSGARRLGSELMVVAIDLDGLKQINDSLGHSEGDKSLISLVTGIENGLRTSDAIFRTGGDEFAIVLPGIGVGEVGALMNRISNGDTPSFTWGASALFDEHQSLSELLNAADADLYRRRHAERSLATGAAVGAAATGIVVGLHRTGQTAMSRISRRTSMAVAAGMLAIGGTFAVVSSLSPTAHLGTALRPSHAGTSSQTTSAPEGNTAIGHLASVVTASGVDENGFAPAVSGSSGGRLSPLPTKVTPPSPTPSPTPGSPLEGPVIGLEAAMNGTVFQGAGMLAQALSGTV